MMCRHNKSSHFHIFSGKRSLAERLCMLTALLRPTIGLARGASTILSCARAARVMQMHTACGIPTHTNITCLQHLWSLNFVQTVQPAARGQGAVLLHGVLRRVQTMFMRIEAS